MQDDAAWRRMAYATDFQCQDAASMLALRFS